MVVQVTDGGEQRGRGRILRLSLRLEPAVHGITSASHLPCIHGTITDAFSAVLGNRADGERIAARLLGFTWLYLSGSAHFLTQRTLIRRYGELEWVRATGMATGVRFAVRGRATASGAVDASTMSRLIHPRKEAWRIQRWRTNFKCLSLADVANAGFAQPVG